MSSVRSRSLVILAVIALAACGSPAPSTPGLGSPSPQPSIPTAAPTPSAQPVTSAGTVQLSSRRLGPDLGVMAFVDAEHGWMAGAGVILGTSDGGLHWQSEWSGIQTVIELVALDRLHVWALAATAVAPASGTGAPSSGDTLLRTADGGTKWTAVPLASSIHGLTFVTPLVGWAVGAADTSYGAGPLLHTSDGGRTWTRTSVEPVSAVCFSDSSHGWAVGANTIRTIDGGRTWRPVSAPIIAGLALPSTLRCRGSALWLFQDRGDGAGGHLNYAGLRSTDGGAHWQEVLGNGFYPSTPDDIGHADDEPGPFDAPDGLTAAELGASPAAEETSVTVTHDGGRNWQQVSLAAVGSAPGPLSFPDPTHGFVVGHGPYGGSGSFLLASDDGGRTWNERWPTTAPDPTAAVSFVSETLGYGIGVVGDARAFLRTTDGGMNWVRVAELPEPVQPLRVDPSTLAFVDPDHGWVVTAAGHLLATADGGLSWRQLSLPQGAGSVGEAALASAQRGCAATSHAGTTVGLFETDDGGATWRPADVTLRVEVCAHGSGGQAVAQAAARLSPILQPRLTFVGDSVAFALLDTALGRTSDGGATWTSVSWPQTAATGSANAFAGPFELSFVSATDGWMLTNDGAVYLTRDGGLSWDQLP